MKHTHFLLPALLLLVSCNISMPPQEQTKNIMKTPPLNESMQGSHITEGTWPRCDWWNTFHEPELTCLIEKALKQNPTIIEARNRLQQAKQEAVIARSNLFPLIYFDADLSNQYVSHNGVYKALNPDFPINATLIDLSLSFSYEFDFWGQYHNIYYAALGRAEVKRAETAEAALIISTALAQSYFALKANLLKKEIYSQLVDLWTKILNLQNLLTKKALSSELPPLLTEQHLLTAKQDLASIENEIAQEKHLINILAGQGPDHSLYVTAHLSPLSNSLAVPKDIPLNLLSRRPDLMVEIWRAKALAYEVGAAMADFYPNINIVGLLGLQSVTYKQLFQASSATWLVQPALSLPLFTAGAIEANVQARRASFEAAIASYNNLLLKSTQDVADTLSFAKAVYTKKTEQDQVVSSAQKRYNISLARVKKGIASMLEAYALQEELLHTEIANINLFYSQYLASIKLIKALGGGYINPGIPLKRCT